VAELRNRTFAQLGEYNTANLPNPKFYRVVIVP